MANRSLFGTPDAPVLDEIISIEDTDRIFIEKYNEETESGDPYYADIAALLEYFDSGYGTIATQDADDVNIDGGTIDDVAINGGTIGGITSLAVGLDAPTTGAAQQIVGRLMITDVEYAGMDISEEANLVYIKGRTPGTVYEVVRTLGGDSGAGLRVVGMKVTNSHSTVEMPYIGLYANVTQANAPALHYWYLGTSVTDTIVRWYADKLCTGSGVSIGVKTNAPTCSLDINANTFRLRTAKTPASAAATGEAGDHCWDANYLYVCTATNTWKRAALSTW